MLCGKGLQSSLEISLICRMKSPAKTLFFGLVLLSICATAPAQPFLTNGLVAYYPFQGNANDQSGNGNNGVVSNATLASDRFGLPNSAYNFNGTDAQILVNDNAALRSLRSNFTFNAWVSFASIPARDIAILIKSFGPGDVDKWVFWRHIEASPFGVGLLSISSGQTVHRTFNYAFNTNQWYMLTFSATPTNCFIAVNGTVVSVQTANFSLPNTTNAPLS
ncbi:MAG: LamG-like jellyroll fold domain-containing protein, partial [Verrucomicrobiota bacterium]